MTASAKIPRFLFLCIFFIFAVQISAQSADMSVALGDLRIEQSLEGGFILWIRKKAAVQSVMIVESTEDPQRKVESHALRNPMVHPSYADEKRLLNGEYLDTRHGYYLIDSTPEPDDEFGEAYRIFVPYLTEYGFPWSRSGEVMVLDGTYLNIRTFEKKYCDYTGVFQDNPFVIQVSQRPLPGPPEANYMPSAVKAFKDISKRGKGEAHFSLGEADVLEQIEQILSDSRGRTLDLVIAIDTTESMANDLPHLQEKLMPLVSRHVSHYENFRIGIVYYRDYFEEYLTRVIPFQTDLSQFQHALRKIRVFGGRDIPEAVHEALYTAVSSFPWLSEKRLVILIGDAPPHPRPRGKISQEMVFSEAESRGVELHTIILPQ